jgi:hypothetical protein
MSKRITNKKANANKQKQSNPDPKKQEEDKLTNNNLNNEWKDEQAQDLLHSAGQSTDATREQLPLDLEESK